MIVQGTVKAQRGHLSPPRSQRKLLTHVVCELSFPDFKVLENMKWKYEYEQFFCLLFFFRGVLLSFKLL